MPAPDPAIALACVLLRKFEGLRLRAYPDQGYGWARATVGYGSTGPDIVKGTVWSREQAEADLAHRVGELVAKIRALVTVPLPDGAIAALVSLAYNCGLDALASSTVMKRINAGNVTGAADAFPMWNKSNGKVLAVLVARRDDERRAYLAALRMT